jgi:hypothetical protein
MRSKLTIFFRLCFCISFCLSDVALAQTNTLKGTAKSNPQAALEYFKKTWLKFPKDFDPEDPSAPKFYSVDTCMYTDENRQDPEATYMDGLRIIARNDVRLSKDLADAGYPPAAWREPLNRLTRKQVEILSQRYAGGQSLDIAAIKSLMRPHEDLLLRTLNTYRKQSAASLPEFETSTSCGGDWIGFVKVITAPRGGSVSLIREYFFQLCVALGKAPYSSECDMWSAAGTSAQFPQGTYRYLARWLDGSDECSRVELVNAGASVDRAQVNTIRQTGISCSK